MPKLKNLWKEAEDRHAGKISYFFLSPTHFAIYFDSLPIFKKYVKGITIDIGAGRLCWKYIIEKFSMNYISTDIKIDSEKLTIASDGSMLPFPDENFDTVISLQVLEHVKEPCSIVKEISRVLKKEGYAIISFPHLSYIHGEPEDYFRYTIYGFKNICKGYLEVEKFFESGGFISFVATPVFIIANSIFTKVPVLREMIFLICAILSVFVYSVDKIFGIKKIYPLNYIAVLKKR